MDTFVTLYDTVPYLILRLPIICSSMKRPLDIRTPDARRRIRGLVSRASGIEFEITQVVLPVSLLY